MTARSTDSVCEEFQEIENQIKQFRKEYEQFQEFQSKRLKKACERKIILAADIFGFQKGSKVLLSGCLDGVHIVTEIIYASKEDSEYQCIFTIKAIGKKGQPIGYDKEVRCFINKKHDLCSYNHVNV